MITSLREVKYDEKYIGVIKMSHPYVKKRSKNRHMWASIHTWLEKKTSKKVWSKSVDHISFWFDLKCILKL